MKNTLTLFILFATSQAFSQVDSIVVHFDKNSSYLNATEVEKLQISGDIDLIEILAYCDYLGSIEYNLWLSQKRANRVKDVLLKNGINSELITKSIGNGEITSNTIQVNGEPENRKVLIYYQSKKLKPETASKIVEAGIETLKLIPKLDSIEIGESISLPKLSFIGGQHNLTPGSESSLIQLMNYLKTNPSYKIAIEGHICCEIEFDDGLDQETGIYNLSTARAIAIYDYLIGNGIEASRLSYEGFGRLMPLYPDEKSFMEQQANRRVEFRLLEK